MTTESIEQRRSYMREYKAKRKNKWLEENGPCRLCGSWESLQVDHIDPAAKAFTIDWGMRADVLEVELQKCQPLCEACHIKKSAAEKTVRPTLDNIPPEKHGTTAGYDYYRCHCDACRGAAAKRARERRLDPAFKKREQERNNVRSKIKRPRAESNYFLGDACPPQKEKEEVHGSAIGYYRNGCRCEICTKWHRELCESRAEELRVFRLSNPIALRPKKPTAHGTAMEYRRGCRCDDCNAANNAQKKSEYVPRERKVGITHGLYASYCSGGCRCDLCKAAAQKYRDERKARKAELPSVP